MPTTPSACRWAAESESITAFAGAEIFEPVELKTGEQDNSSDCEFTVLDSNTKNETA